MAEYATHTYVLAAIIIAAGFLIPALIIAVFNMVKNRDDLCFLWLGFAFLGIMVLLTMFQVPMELMAAALFMGGGMFFMSALTRAENQQKQHVKIGDGLTVVR